MINMADVSILADVPYLLHPNDSTSGFIHPASEDDKADLRLEVRPAEKLPDAGDVRFEEGRRVYAGEGQDACTFFRTGPGREPYAFVSRRLVPDGKLVCEYLPGNEKYMDYARNLITLMDIEATLLDFGSLILHASLIRYGGKGIIFSAPSGTGKSTQAELWERYEGAEVLNGDRAALRKFDGSWQAYGLPYAGTSGIYRNESAPLRAIVILRQADENHICRIKGAEAFRFLYPETMIHRWDPQYERKASALLLDVLAEVPVFLLECRPDREAVTLLRNILETEEMQ